MLTLQGLPGGGKSPLRGDLGAAETDGAGGKTGYFR